MKNIVMKKKTIKIILRKFHRTTEIITHSTIKRILTKILNLRMINQKWVEYMYQFE